MVERVQVWPGRPVDLASLAPDDRLGLAGRKEAKALTARCAERLEELGTLLAADARHALLVVFQGLDASGKDGSVKRCIGPLNPMMVMTTAFTVPSAEERAHDFLWRVHQRLPRRGQVGAFNRSHYEDVLVPRVEDGAPADVWEPRCEAINEFERHLVREGTTVLKFFLHISREEQAERLRARIAKPRKRWKFDAADLDKRRRWDAYQAAYRDVLERTSTEWAPWHVVPADRKWVRNLVVSQVMVETLETLDLRWPDLDPDVGTVVLD
jgi:PPK2 family polyphosphate:nucleotide phosphotransferase